MIERIRLNERMWVKREHIDELYKCSLYRDNCNRLLLRKQFRDFLDSEDWINKLKQIYR